MGCLPPAVQTAAQPVHKGPSEKAGAAVLLAGSRGLPRSAGSQLWVTAGGVPGQGLHPATWEPVRPTFPDLGKPPGTKLVVACQGPLCLEQSSPGAACGGSGSGRGTEARSPRSGAPTSREAGSENQCRPRPGRSWSGPRGRSPSQLGRGLGCSVCPGGPKWGGGCLQQGLGGHGAFPRGGRDSCDAAGSGRCGKGVPGVSSLPVPVPR